MGRAPSAVPGLSTSCRRLPVARPENRARLRLLDTTATTAAMAGLIGRHRHRRPRRGGQGAYFLWGGHRGAVVVWWGGGAGRWSIAAPFPAAPPPAGEPRIRRNTLYFGNRSPSVIISFGDGWCAGGAPLPLKCRFRGREKPTTSAQATTGATLRPTQETLLHSPEAEAHITLTTNRFSSPRSLLRRERKLAVCNRKAASSIPFRPDQQHARRSFIEVIRALVLARRSVRRSRSRCLRTGQRDIQKKS